MTHFVPLSEAEVCIQYYRPSTESSAGAVERSALTLLGKLDNRSVPSFRNNDAIPSMSKVLEAVSLPRSIPVPMMPPSDQSWLSSSVARCSTRAQP
jgi:hypothetical protein